MHVVHLIAVEAETEEDAIRAAEDFLSSYEGEVWDWFEVGGRWDGLLGGKNVLKFTDNPELFVQSIETALTTRDRTFIEYKQYITGEHVTPEAAPDNIYGLAVNDPESYTEGRNKIIDRYHEEYQGIINADSLSNLPHKFSMVGYYLRKLGSLVGDYYNSDSMFYDTVYGSTFAGGLKERIIDPEAAHLQHLVVVDLHN